jgi:hypothetical protein
MNHALQYLLTGMIVAAAAFYAAWNLAGPSNRLRWASWALRHVHANGWMSRVLQRQVMRQSASVQGGGCGTCKSAPDNKSR